MARIAGLLMGMALAFCTARAAAQVACGTYGAESRPTTQTSCPVGGGACNHEKLDAPLLNCDGSSAGSSCTWISEVTPSGGCTTCTAMSNSCSPRVCSPSTCGSGSYGEVCDGFDNDGGGQIDEGCPVPDGSPEEITRVSQVHAPTGAFVPAVRQDIHYAGGTLPMRFSRVYTSLDYWPYDVGSRLGAGWFHTYDERLFDGSTLGPPSPSSTSIIHRVGARGRLFTCVSGSCTTNDGSLDTLDWDSGSSTWQLTHSNGVTTEFYGSGADWKKGALHSKLTTRGDGWTVTYWETGTLTSHVRYVTDHLGRKMTFDWQPAAQYGAPPQLQTIKDSAGVTLVSFEYNVYARLAGATSAAGIESYDYWVDGNGNTTKLMTGLVVGSQTAVSVTYDTQAGTGFLGRVATISEAAASVHLRYRGESRNACSVPGESVMIVDRSTEPVGQSSCTDDASGDAWCAQQAGVPAVCDAGLCRAIACQRYGDLVNSAGEDRLTALTGNCPCGGVSTMGWTSAGSEAPRRPAWEVSRDGKTTSYAYDTRGRIVARCENDSDTTVTTTSSSCPTSGTWNAWEYNHGTFTTFVTKQRGRSRLDSSETSITLTYDTNHPELTQIVQVGKTRDAATDTNITETQTTSYVYDTSGRITQQTLPAGEITTFGYNSKSGNGYGLLETANRWVDSQGTSKLTTTFGSYTTLGRPGSVTHPSSAVTSYVYDYGGMRMTSSARAGETTTYTYESGTGRLLRVTEPSGRRTKYTYDSMGRVQYEDVIDADASLAADRTEYTYDAAGRRTQVIRRRVDSQGIPQAVEWQLEATFDEHGYELTRKYGARSAIQYSLDPNGMGRVEGVTREDGDQVTMSYDAFGRELEYRRYITGQSSGAYTSSYTSPTNEQGEDLPTSITDPHSVVRSYVYDDFSRLVKSSSADFGTMRWEYANGELVERRLGNGKYSTYSYDFLGRITSINHDAGSTGVVGQDFNYIYDNGGLTCGISGSSCTYRKGRLGKVQIEYAPGSFWDLEYDYGQNGRVTAERWPSSRQANYTWDSQGRLLRTEMPVATSDKIRYEYDATSNDGEDPSELRRIVHELTAGSDYLVWSRNISHDALGRQVRAHFADRLDGTSPSIDNTYNTDGTVNLWRVRRRSSSSDIYMMSRAYSYHADGQVKGWTTGVTADPARTFFWDGANRLTCAASAANLGTCPTGSTLLESYTYDLHENRATKNTPAGQTTYYNPYTNNQFWDEYPPSHTIWYGYDSNMFGGRSYDVHHSVSTSNQRTYYYYASGGLRSIAMYAPGATQGVQESHTFSLVYDHKGRPIYITDHNNATGKERREQLYWDLEDNLIERVITPDASAAGTYSVDIFANMESAATGWMRLEYVNSSFQSETRRYAVRDPSGLVAAVYSFSGTGATQVVYTADYQPFGEVRAQSTSTEPGLGHGRQVAITGSEARVWSGQTISTLRSRLMLSDTQPFDARVGAQTTALNDASTVVRDIHPYTLPPPVSLIRATAVSPSQLTPTGGHVPYGPGPGPRDEPKWVYPRQRGDTSDLPGLDFTLATVPDPGSRGDTSSRDWECFLPPEFEAYCQGCVEPQRCYGVPVYIDPRDPSGAHWSPFCAEPVEVEERARDHCFAVSPTPALCDSWLSSPFFGIRRAEYWVVCLDL